MPWLTGASWEVLTIGRAALSSFFATLNDGLVYQELLSIGPGHYRTAALAGALVGALTNFCVNRSWTFRGPWKPVHLQVAQYAVGAILTFSGLQVVLWLLIEQLELGERIAWLPAKGLSFLAISYPFQRFLVFADVSRRKREWPP